MTVRNEGHRSVRLRLLVVDGIACVGIERGARGIHIIDERTLNQPEALLAHKQVEVGERHERHLPVKRDPIRSIINRPHLAILLKPFVPGRRLTRRLRAVKSAVATLLEDMRQRHTTRCRGRTRTIGKRTVDVEIIGNVNRRIGITTSLKTKFMPARSRRMPGIIARLVNQRWRQISEPLERQSRDRVAVICR